MLAGGTRDDGARVRLWGAALPPLGIAILVAVMAVGGTPPAGPRVSVIRGGDFVAFWVGGKILADDGGATELYDRSRARAELRRTWNGKCCCKRAFKQAD